MPKVETPEGLHKEVKKFAVDYNMSVKDAYACLVRFALEQKHDKHALKKILNQKGADDDIIVGS
jgi:hypothetical protein